MSNVLTPYYQLFIKGEEIDSERYSMIEEIVFEDNSSGSDLLSITINDPNFIFLNDDIFIEEAKVKFIGGYLDNHRVMFEGYIATIDVDFPNTGCPTMTLNCMDNTHLMNRSKKKRTWKNKKRSDIASQIFKEYGLTAVVDASPRTEEDISQSNETDIVFLEKLAGEEIDTYLVYVEGNKGYYVKKKLLDSPQATLDYREGNMQIMSFSPTINKQSKQVEVEKSQVNLYDKTINKSCIDNTTPRNVQGQPIKY